MTSKLLITTSAVALVLAAAACKPSTRNEAANAGNNAATATENAVGSATEAVKNAASNVGMPGATPSAADFVTKAAQANLFEIETSKLAVERTKSPSVKKFAQEMIKDHTKAGDQLKAAVAKAGVTATVPTALEGPMKDKLDALKNASASDFNDKYVDMQGEAHEDAARMFKAYADNGDNAELKTFAAATLPTLEKHFDEVKTIDKTDANDKVAAKK
jgi:putative membrane protein